MIEVFYDGCTLAMKIILLTFSRWEVRGRENVPSNGPLIVTANHLSFVDPPLLSASIPRRIAFMAKKELWRKPYSRWPVAAFGAFPVDRGGRDMQALRTALELLRSGQVLGMFPEGTRSRSGHMGPGNPGSALVALRSGAAILPVGISGSEEIKGLATLAKRPSIMVTIGKPYVLPQAGRSAGRDEMAVATRVIMDRIAELLPERYRPLPDASVV